MSAEHKRDILPEEVATENEAAINRAREFADELRKVAEYEAALGVGELQTRSFRRGDTPREDVPIK